MRTVVAGCTVTQDRDQTYLSDVVGRSQSDERKTLGTRRELQVRWTMAAGSRSRRSQHEVFWGPMAYAVIGGLAVATLLTLIVPPAGLVSRARGPLRPPAPTPLRLSRGQIVII